MKLARTILISTLLGALLVSVAATAKEKEPQTPGRLLTGRVVDRQENALPNAVVYVTDTRSRAVVAESSSRGDSAASAGEGDSLFRPVFL